MRDWLILAFFGLSIAPAYSQATLHTYTDKAAFLAATGATPPLPNLGQIDNATVGSPTFSPTAPHDTLYIGAFGSAADPDWYPARPGNEIAMTAEHLTVEAAVPVYSLGFEFIEPKTTVQPWGGTPVNSTYKVMLFNGPTLVGEFLFDAPDDVVLLGDAADQQGVYLSEISEVALPSPPPIRVADLTTRIPQGTGSARRRSSRGILCEVRDSFPHSIAGNGGSSSGG